MPDISLMGAVYPDVPFVLLPVDGGGQAKFTYGWDWMGLDAELVATVYPKTVIKLKNTDFPSWTPSTTADVIYASQTLQQYTLDMANYAYIVRWQSVFQAAYTSGAVLANIPYRICHEKVLFLFKRPYNVLNVESDNLTYNQQETLWNSQGYINCYYNASGSKAALFRSTQYGFYPNVQNGTFSNTTSNTPKYTIKTPTISAVCNDTYFKTTAAPYLDQDNSIFTLKGELFRVDKMSMPRSIEEEIVDIYNNGIT